jgi:hypothetical protein
MLGGLDRVPRPLWYLLAIVISALLAWAWHSDKVETAYARGAAEQSRIDEQRVREASAAAEAGQNALRTALKSRQMKVTKGSDDALLAKNADLARRYDDLRLRWASYRADQGSAGESGATAFPRTAVGVDDAACAAAGWVSFDFAAAAAEAADTAIARDDAWRAWVTAQAMAWPE